MKDHLIKFEKDHWFFITSTILHHTHIFHKREYANIVLGSLNYFAVQEKLYIGAYVLMPNHLHLITKMRGNTSQASYNRDFKKFTAQQIILTMKDKKDPLLDKFLVNKSDRKIQIWKRGPNVQNIYSQQFMIQKANYIHNNPCQTHWNLVESSDEYEYSSAPFYLSDKKENSVNLFDLRSLM